MIKRYYSITIQIKPSSYHEQKANGNPIIASTMIDYRSMLADPYAARIAAWQQLIDQDVTKSLTHSNTIITSFSRC